MIGNVKLNLPIGLMGGTEILVDGHDMTTGVRGLTLTARVGEIPTLQLELLVREHTVAGRWVVEIDPRSKSLLERLGWTPPAQDDVADVRSTA